MQRARVTRVWVSWRVFKRSAKASAVVNWKRQFSMRAARSSPTSWKPESFFFGTGSKAGRKGWRRNHSGGPDRKTQAPPPKAAGRRAGADFPGRRAEECQPLLLLLPLSFLFYKPHMPGTEPGGWRRRKPSLRPGTGRGSRWSGAEGSGGGWSCSGGSMPGSTRRPGYYWAPPEGKRSGGSRRRRRSRAGSVP